MLLIPETARNVLIFLFFDGKLAVHSCGGEEKKIGFSSFMITYCKHLLSLFVTSVCLPDWLSMCNNSKTAEQFSVQFYTGEFCWNASTYSNFCSKSDNNTGQYKWNYSICCFEHIFGTKDKERQELVRKVKHTFCVWVLGFLW